jgi:signal transduction histidine kinase
MILPNAGAPRRDSASAHVLIVNQCFTRIFNIGQERAQGLSLTQLLERMQLPEDVRQQLAHHWLRIPVRDPSTQHGEFNMMHPQGYPASIEWHSAPVYQDNRVLGRIYTFHDVSADRTAANLRASFISRMSHELRTPLTSIQGFAQFILEDIPDDISPIAREYAGIIFDNARHLNILFSDIIEMSRADTGELRLNVMNASLPDLISEVAAQFKADAEAQGKTIAVELDTFLPPVQMDSNRIARVVQQLIGNALKHTPPDTCVRINARYLTNSDQLPEDAPPDVVLPAVMVVVADEGNGLSTEEAKDVFTPFSRTREARTARMPGVGLGLTIARSLIELHRGKIWAAPRRRKLRGGQFYFTLPTAEE